jgi:hypothetical protein
MNDQQSLSRNHVPIRLTDERWQHIIEEHAELVGLRDEVLEAVTQAERVLSGTAGELLGIRTMTANKVLVVVYRETTQEDGFVITAFITRRLASLNRREQLWPPQM